MAYVWFQEILKAIGRKINFESISNLYGNSFCKDSAKYVEAANPLVNNGGANTHGGAQIAGLVGSIKVVKGEGKEGQQKAAEKVLGMDLSWAEGLF